MRFVVGLSTLIPSPANINHSPINHALVGYETRYPLVNLWKITIFKRQINYRWQFSIAMLNYQRVFGTILDTGVLPGVVQRVVDRSTKNRCQAMVRYVAQRGKLWGTSPEESVLVDMIAEGIKDARGELGAKMDRELLLKTSGKFVIKVVNGNDMK